jgi:hypothetical protein
MKADLSQLYLLGEGFKRGAVRAEITCPCDNDDIAHWISGHCKKPIILKQKEGRNFCDLMGTGYTLDLISSRIADAVREAGMTGLATCPAELTAKNGDPVTGYEVLGTIGRCGPLQNDRSPKVRQLNKVGTAMMDIWLGYYFDEDTWDGSDVFRPDGTRMTLVTKRVKDLIEGMGATNITFTPILEIERLVL